MKNKILLVTVSVLIFAFAFINVKAQKYIRYNFTDRDSISNKQFCGFYSENVDSLITESRFSTIYMGKIVKEIPIEYIDSITVEGCNVNDENVIGKYRIYEYDVTSDMMVDNVPVSNYFKKAYFDNRAVLMTSTTGTFESNDTIMLYSDFYKSRVLLITDSKSQIVKYFDGDFLIDVDYFGDGISSYNILNVKDSVFSIVDIKIQPDITRGWKETAFKESLKALRKGLTSKEFKKWAMETATEEVLMNSAERMIDVLSGNDPELHHQKILFQALGVAKDVLGIIGTAGAGFGTSGAAWLALGTEFCFLVNDFKDLLAEWLFYDHSKYKDFYKNKYNVDLYDETVENITRNSATLKCILSTDDVRKGYAKFEYGPTGVDYANYSIVEANITNISENKYLLTAQIGGLEPQTKYDFFPSYTVKVDGMRFYYCGSGSFKTKPNKLPNMAGKWTFNQTHFSDKSINLDLKLSSVNRDSTRATYQGGWGANTVGVIVYSNGNGTIIVNASKYYGIASFQGFFNSDYTCLSGERYYRCVTYNDPGRYVEDSWSLSR